MSRFGVSDTAICGLKIVDLRKLGDARGSLTRVFCAAELRSAGWTLPVAQANVTHTMHAGTVRGLHYQKPPHAEMKLVSCLQGEVWDVAVDLRADSATFLNWHAERLSGENQRALLIPEGCAHGFQTLVEGCAMLYFHSSTYAPQSEAGVNASDPALKIAWPLPVGEMSERDRAFPLIDRAFTGVPA